jgi:hypothetical protein
MARARARRAASISQTLSPTTEAVSILILSRSAAVRKRSGSGFAGANRTDAIYLLQAIWLRFGRLLVEVSLPLVCWPVL